MEPSTKTQKTKIKILDAAQSLMMEKGFVATSIDEICKMASTTKGSFFHYFDNKETLGVELAKRFSEMTLDMFIKACSDAGDDPLDRIFAVTDLVGELSESPDYKGCLLGTFTQELARTHPNINKVCCASFDNVAKILKDELKKANKIYIPDSSIEIDNLAIFLVSIIQGSIIVLKAKQDHSIVRNNLLQFKEYIKLVFRK